MNADRDQVPAEALPLRPFYRNLLLSPLYAGKFLYAHVVFIVFPFILVSFKFLAGKKMAETVSS